ncbi:MAG: sulfite exporter TauE/SafE family protein [Desulfobacterales bacterium]|nr:sulfite exporter TauE/SafE family protein [Desulfobacterales bacterium]MBF0397374.1 sulfite exporter TauE/SafE family protein [Desulfobacterales bacterium]
MSENAKTKGWEIAQELEEKTTIMERLVPDKEQLKAAVYSMIALFVVFLIGCWLASNPFEFTKRIASPIVDANKWMGTNEWAIVWSVVFIAMFFEFMDATAGMGFGTAITPLLLAIGFSPQQIVPVVMIQQGIAGLVGTFLHKEFENVEWKFKPMSETIKLWLYIAVTGSISVAISSSAVYALFKVAKVWISLYVAVLLLMMGIISLMQARIGKRPYRPKMMIGFAFLAGFNKGIGGGGYGPVVTIGGLMSGVPAKAMMAVTAISEGTVSTFSIIIWFAMILSGSVVVDYLLLPSMMLATMFSAVVAPWATRVFPEKVWQIVVPFYSLLLAAYTFYKAIPPVLQKLKG